MKYNTKNINFLIYPFFIFILLLISPLGGTNLKITYNNDGIESLSQLFILTDSVIEIQNPAISGFNETSFNLTGKYINANKIRFDPTQSKSILTVYGITVSNFYLTYNITDFYVLNSRQEFIDGNNRYFAIPIMDGENKYYDLQIYFNSSILKFVYILNLLVIFILAIFIYILLKRFMHD